MNIYILRIQPPFSSESFYFSQFSFDFGECFGHGGSLWARTIDTGHTGRCKPHPRESRDRETRPVERAVERDWKDPETKGSGLDPSADRTCPGEGLLQATVSRTCCVGTTGRRMHLSEFSKLLKLSLWE